MLRVVVARRKENAIAYTQKFVDVIKAQVDKSIEATKNFEPHDDKEKMAVLTVANNLIHNLQKCMHDLQQLAIPFRSQPTISTIMDGVIKQLSSIIERSIDVSTDNMQGSKDDIIKNLETLHSQIDPLAKLNAPDFPFKHKHDVVILLTDFLVSAQEVELRFILQRSTYEQVLYHLVKVRDANVKVVESFRSTDLAIISEIVHTNRHCLQKFLEMNDELDVEVDNFDEETVRSLIVMVTAQIAAHSSSLRDALSTDNELEVFKAALFVGIMSLSVAMKQLAGGLQLKIDDIDCANNTNNVILTAIVHAISISWQCTQAMQRLLEEL